MTNTKRILSIFMAIIFTVCTTLVTSAEQSSHVVTATALVDSLPDVATITDPDSQAYANAVDAAWKAVYALAECSEEQMMNISDFHKPFDMLFILWVLPADLNNAPKTIPMSKEEVFAQVEWVIHLSDIINDLPEGYSVLNVYTSTDDQGNQLGTDLLEKLVDLYYDIAIRVEAYVSTLPEEEQHLLNQEIDAMYEERHPTPSDAQRFADEVAQFPQTFTVDNILDYATDFYLLNEETEYGWYDLTDVAQADLDKYYRLSEEFQVIIGIHRDQVLDQLEQRIAETCDLAAVKTYSPLKIQLLVKHECLALERTIYTIEDTLGGYTDRNIENLDLFYEYYSTVFDTPYLPPYIAGDVNNDGETTAADALELLKAVVGKIHLTTQQEYAADVDEDGQTSAQDALAILKYVVGKLESLPV